ncbi:asparagine synthase (glutamine-hydrolyzing) [Echinicola jeungdonensis]|uniref:asparagine synthase (glutamine-hydrolyzing) n=1 Tax=Echinicola jeungdonensis TaxID=709343 RepID=A0ABV5J6Q4_9BACT|nr:asparagine synthase (glutamine-hydrolyzing) [Echinicola jeungdonensis]MDN3667880.1 asparagine synthase (glutamine-hydrolyzing) [Echinicola jeungdonensis]
MCGILGQLKFKNSINRENFELMLSSLIHRGPDGFGLKGFEEDRVYLGHRRLSIIDLSDRAKQPISNENESLWLTFNGEIYNYKSLRKELITKGHKFKSDSDSEVIIHGYEEWGVDCLNKLRGIFAFGIFDKNKKEIFLARDHAGVKPLFYYQNENVFLFSSEPKAFFKCDSFRKELNKEALNLYLAFGNVPGEYSIFKGVKKLLPGHYLKLSINSLTPKVVKYWELKYQPKISNKEEAIFKIKDKIEESIELQTLSDVPVGSLLSGGIDSSIITSFLVKRLPYSLSTFSIGFDEKSSDESEYAKLIADSFQTDHIHKEINADIANSCLEELISINEEPFHYNGLFPYLSLANLVKNKGHKVVLGGDGADELFAGYNWYDDFNNWYNQFAKPTYRQRLASIWRGEVLNRKDPISKYITYNGYLSSVLRDEIFGLNDSELITSVISSNWNQNYSPVLNSQIIDFHCFMPDHCLVKVDKISMAKGIEVRVPFLDIELIELVFSIDENLIYNNGEKKFLLKKAMKNYFPENMHINRKKGFSSPIEKWKEEIIGNDAFSILINGALVKNDIINGDALIRNFNKMNSYDQLLLIGLEHWFKKWFQ